MLAAVASYLDARRHEGRWLVRIDDIDPPREMPGADTLILEALERYGFEWDGEISYQSRSGTAHREALDALLSGGHAYRCACSRRDLANAPRGPLGTIYPGTCRAGTDADEFAIRVLTTGAQTGFDDRLQGAQSMQLETESGDFIIWRRDGLVAYQLAVVVDDALAGVTDIVRGIDLMDSVPRQIWLQQLLGFTTPRYAHIPVAINEDGSKLSKLTGATALPLTGVSSVLSAALAALGQQPPAELAGADCGEVWAWAQRHWAIERVRNAEKVSTQSNALASTENPLR